MIKNDRKLPGSSGTRDSLGTKIDNLIFEIISANDGEILRENFLRRFKDILVFDAASFDLAKIINDQIVFDNPVVLNIEKKFVQKYYSHFQYIDTMAFFFSQDKKDVYRTSDYINKEMRESSEYYNEWLRPQNLFYSIGAKIANKKTLYGSVNFWRSRKKGDFTDAELRTLSVFVKYFSKKFSEFDGAEKEKEWNLKRLLAFYDEYNLTARERELTDELIQGKKIRDIADALFICEDTVKKHTNHIYKKTGVKSKAELILKINSAKTEK
jgi:DNA-binding CsgD family transcriptional regulator